MRHTCVTPCVYFLTRICESVFQVVSSFQLLGSKKVIYFCLASMSATFPAHFIVLGLRNVTTEKIIVNLKRTNLLYIHVIQSYLYLNSFYGRPHNWEKRLFSSSCLPVCPSVRVENPLHFIWGEGEWLLISVEKIRVCLKSDENSKHFK